MNNKTRSPKEKRRFRRVPLDVDLFYEVSRLPDVRLKTKAPETTTRLVNICEGGIAFVSSLELAISTELRITFHLFAEKAESSKISAIGEVRYCILRGDYKTYQVGVEFTKIKKSDRKLIADYVETQKKDQLPA